MPTRPAFPATLKQRNFLKDLANERQVGETAKASVLALAEREDLTGHDASQMIETLMARPKIQRPRPPITRATSPWAAVNAKLADLITSKFAIYTRDLPTALQALANGNDMLFLENREYRGRRYFRQLHGAPGRFNRTGFGPATAEALIDYLSSAGHALEAGKRFSVHYTCCARCGAELTDTLSRAAGYGPECRRHVGIA